MLDVFLEVVSGKTREAEAFDALVDDFSKLPTEELAKIASGQSKLAYGDDDDWLSKFEDTDLYEQALALEQECLEVDIARQKHQLEQCIPEPTPPAPEFYRLQDAVRLKKRILDLELNKMRLAEMGGSLGGEPEEEMLPAAMEPSEGAGEPNPLGELKQAFAKEALSPAQKAALTVGGAATGMGAIAGYNRGAAHGQGAKGAILGGAGTAAGGVLGAALGGGVLGAPNAGAALGAMSGYSNAMGGFKKKDKEKEKLEKSERKKAKTAAVPQEVIEKMRKEAMGAALLAGAKGLAGGAKALGGAAAKGFQRQGMGGALHAAKGLGTHQVGQAAQWAGKNRGAAAALGAGAIGAGFAAGRATD
jgi:hypothetical protein